MIGTPGYVDPYKYKASKGTHSSDMFSLGVTFLELLIPEFPSLLKQRVRDLNATDNMKDNDISLQYERVNNDQKYRKFLIDDVINKYLPKEHHSIKSLLFYLLGATYISGSPPTATGALQQLEYIQKKRRLI